MFSNLFFFLKEKRGYIYLLLMFFTSGISTVFAKILLNGRYNAFHVLTYTSFIGLMVLIYFNQKRSPKQFIKSSLGIKWLVVAAITGFSLYEITFNLALQYMPVIQTITIYYSYPIFLYLAGVIFLKIDKEKVIKGRILIGIIFGFTGVYFVLTKGSLIKFSLNIGFIYIIISIISIITFIILGKKKDIPELQFLFMGQTISFITGIFILTINNWWIIPNLQELFYMIFIAVVYNIINAIFYIKAIQLLSVEWLSTLSYLSPIVTSYLAIIILKERVIATTILGILLVILGNMISGHKDRKKEEEIHISKK